MPSRPLTNQSGRGDLWGGGKGRVIGIGSFIIPRLSKLKNVLLVEGLIVNLICVIQLCDKDLLVKFTKDK